VRTATSGSDLTAGTRRRPRKELGQHFLVDGKVLGKILRAAHLQDTDVVVEIGAGTGVLTKALAGRVARLIAVELDSTLAQRLKESLGPAAEVLEGDARHIPIYQLFDGDLPSNYKLMGNLPYYTATYIVQRFLEAETPPALTVVMLQREVAENMVAGPGHASLLSVVTQVMAKPSIVAYVSPHSFRPQPKVGSAIVKLERRDDPPVTRQERQGFFRLVRAGFNAPRKQLRNSLALGLGISNQQADVILNHASVDPSLRAQTLSIDQWLSIYHRLEETSQG